jgi:hypothetical protein
MIVNGIEVQSEEHLEILIAEMDEESKVGVRILYAEETSQG